MPHACFLSKSRDTPWLWKKCSVTQRCQQGKSLFMTPKVFDKKAWRAAFLVPSGFPWPCGEHFCASHFLVSSVTRNLRRRLKDETIPLDEVSSSKIKLGLYSRSLLFFIQAVELIYVSFYQVVSLFPVFRHTEFSVFIYSYTTKILCKLRQMSF